MRRLEHRLDHEPGAAREVLLLDEQSFVALQLSGFERSPEGLQTKASNKLGAACGGGLAGEQTARGAWAERIPGQTLGCRSIRLYKKRRQVLGLILVLEAVYEIFGGKLRGGSRAVSEQVTDGIVVLTMGQAPNGNVRDGTPFFRLFFAVSQRLREFLALQSS